MPVFVVHCTHPVSLLYNGSYCCRQQGLKVFGGGLEELQVEDEGEIQRLGEQIYSVGFLHLQLIHILALSPQVTVYIA